MRISTQNNEEPKIIAFVVCKLVIASPFYNSDVFYAEVLERKRHEIRRTHRLRMEKSLYQDGAKSGKQVWAGR
jgi:hypothetical protein